MSRKPKGDNVPAVLEAIRAMQAHNGQRKRSGNMRTEWREVPLAKIERGTLAERVQFRQHLSQDTLEGMAATLGNGGALPPPVLVEAALYDDQDGERAARAVAEAQEDDDLGYLTGDGAHRIETYRDMGSESITALVVVDAQDPFNVARDISIRSNITPQTGVSDAERQNALYTEHELYPDMGVVELGNLVGYSHTHVRRLLLQRRATLVLREAGSGVPSNKSLLEELGKLAEDLDERDEMYQRAQDVVPEIKNVAVSEKWTAEDLSGAWERVQRITQTDWSAQRDWRGQPAMLGNTWAQLGEVVRLRLARAANKEGWTDEELVWSARYAQNLSYAEAPDEKAQYRDLLAGNALPEVWMSDSSYYKDYEHEPVTWEPSPEPEPVPNGAQDNGAQDSGTQVQPAEGGAAATVEPETGTPPTVEVGRTEAQQQAGDNINRAMTYAVRLVETLGELMSAAGNLDADEADRVLTWAGTLEAGAHALGLIAARVAQENVVVDLTS
jgi:hypothetical protein